MVEETDAALFKLCFTREFGWKAEFHPFTEAFSRTSKDRSLAEDRSPKKSACWHLRHYRSHYRAHYGTHYRLHFSGRDCGRRNKQASRAELELGLTRPLTIYPKLRARRCTSLVRARSASSSPAHSTRTCS